MFGSTQSFLKQATKLFRPSTPNPVPLMVTCGASSTNNPSSVSPDYDKIMCTGISAFSSNAGNSTSSPSSTSSAPHLTCSPGMGVAQDVVKSNCYRSVNEPTGCEDYDGHELHHPPCEKTYESSPPLEAMAQLPTGMGVAHDVIKWNCYWSVDEPTGCEDYDGHELHHPPCKKTHESYFNDSYETCGMIGW
mmetsp:Transcript_35469/g.75741  ORF Transcript_35469/g.75741 Transcript_35469/m.75741 type:complete len:191 (+) Transcript_35469:301-873(+)